MSSTLDLNGATYTITEDTTETYYQVTDGSVSHDGELVIEAGGCLQFDDATGSGFTTACTAITITILGEADAYAYMKSVDDIPHHAWALPPTTITMDATRCKFRDCTGAHGAAWTLSHCEWGADQCYCTVTDVRHLTGVPESGTSGVSDAAIALFIKNASDEIEEKTGRKWTYETSTQERHDYDGKQLIKLSHYPIIDISLVEYRTDSTLAGTWETKTENPVDGDWWASDDDLARGQVRVIVPPSYGLDAVRVTYTYGQSTTPWKIRKVCMYLAAIETYRAAAGAGTPNIYSKEMENLATQVTKLLESVGTELDIYAAPFAQASTRYGSKYPRGDDISRLV